jgi:hypothetical protein
MFFCHEWKTVNMAGVLIYLLKIHILTSNHIFLYDFLTGERQQQQKLLSLSGLNETKYTIFGILFGFFPINVALLMFSVSV